jgi:galactofuranosylgalactofuranosylrhamnosyl-N-acetylglucosaminyl-diphospho-decaprenol beta-1,5/1,6-galactofuranosyltransferase
MRRVYRDAVPVLSSKEKWETVLLPTQSNAAGNGRHRG